MNSSKINEAVNFLLHPDVQPMNDEAKREFLRSKGLSPEEIEAAYIEARQQEIARREGFWSLRNVVAVGTSVYLAYRAVKGLMNWLTAEEAGSAAAASAEAMAAQKQAEEEERRQQRAEEALEELRARVASQEAELKTLREEVANLAELRGSLTDASGQIESLRKAVLSKISFFRNSFPSPSYLRPAVESGASSSPSVPSWQLSQRTTRSDATVDSTPQEPSEVPMRERSAVTNGTRAAEDASSPVVKDTDSTVATTDTSAAIMDAAHRADATIVSANGDGTVNDNEDVD